VFGNRGKKDSFQTDSRLKTPYREIALDYFYNELSAAEISAKQVKNLKTVQTQIYRANHYYRKPIKRGCY
jgi:RNA polymerase sigma-70 factor (ECF subfamily)